MRHDPTYTSSGCRGPTAFRVDCTCGWGFSGAKKMDPQLAFGRHLLAVSQPIDPIKLCCGKRMSEHRGPQCPDGKVMCCYCFERVEVEELMVDPVDGRPVDVCKPCKALEDAAMARKKEQHGLHD